MERVVDKVWPEEIAQYKPRLIYSENYISKHTK